MVSKSNRAQIEALSREKQTNLHRGKYKEVAEICNYLGELLVQEERYEDAISEHETELEMCEKVDDALGKAIAHRRIGECYCALGDYEKAIEHQQQHLTIARNLGNEIEQQRAHATLGRTYLCQAEVIEDSREALRKAQQEFNSSLNLASILKDEIDASEYHIMIGRLYLNLGIVCEISGHFTSAIKYLHDARTEMSGKKLDEEEQRCLVTLSGIYQKTGNYSSAREFADAAYATAKSMKDKSLIADCLLLRSSIYFESESFDNARHCLKNLLKTKILDFATKAKKLMHSLGKIKELVGKVQKCQERERLKLLEKIGDEYCRNDCFFAGRRYYRKTLDLAEQLGRPASELASIYVSLAQTCADLKMYKEAIKYSMEELKLRSDPEQICRTWLNIADYTYHDDDSDDLTAELYNNAIKEAEKANKPKLLLQCLQDQQSLFRTTGDEERAADLDDRIRRVAIRVNAAEDEDEEDVLEKSRSITPDIFDLSSVTESDDDVANEDDTASQSLRKRGQYKIRKNEKGETDLHVAVINGNSKRVRNLLALGHPVNERDHCGWLPIHEAANHNQLEIAKLLIENNAWINDKGLKECSGMTPILDAAYCGNFEMVKLLQERGASITCKDDDGNTIIDALLSWKKEASEGDGMDDAVQEEFDQLVANLQGAMLAAGVAPNKLRSHGNASKQKAVQPASQPSSSRKSSHPADASPRLAAKKRRSASPLPESNPTEFYREAIGNVGSKVRQKRKRSRSPKFSKSVNDEALVRAEDFVGDNWLIADIEEEAAPRISREASDILFTSGLRAGSSKPNKSTTRHQTASPRPRASKPDSQSSVSDYGSSSPRLTTPSGTASVRSNQTKSRPVILLNDDDFGDDHGSGRVLDVPEEEVIEDIEAPLYDVAPAREHLRNRPSASPLIDAGVIRPVVSAAEPLRPTAIRRQRIRIEDSLILVPISGADKTIAWLEEEAAKRYAETKGLTPVLQLKSQDGAVLFAGDKITDVVGDQEEILATPLSWNVPPISDRYRKACEQTKKPAFQNVLHLLQAGNESGNLNLSESYLDSSSAQPVLRTIQFQSSLKHLSLSTVPIGDAGFSLLLEALTTMLHLAHLNLACTDLTSTSLENMKRTVSPLTAGGPRAMQSLTFLGLSHNEFQDIGGRIAVAIAAELPSLEELELADCGITSRLLDRAADLRHSLSKCARLKRLSLALNCFTNRDLVALVPLLPKALKVVNFGACTNEIPSLAENLASCGLDVAVSESGVVSL